MRILQIFVVLLVVQNQAQAFYHAYDDYSSEAFDEHSHYFEADILADTELLKMASKDNHKLWDGGKVPYIIDFDPGEHVYVHDNIMAAIDAINEVECVYFYESNGEADAVNIKLGPDYSSYVGRQGGIQDLTVSNDNTNTGTIMHELMHTLGFGHEHNRPDRDDYIIVHWDNIKEDAKQYFTKYPEGYSFTNNSIAYDYRSLMHATNQKNEDIFIDLHKPIITRLNGSIDVGQRSHLTDLDKERIKITYNCGVCDDAPDNTLFRYPGDCHKYYQCDHHNPVVRDCNPELHFSASSNYCDYPPQANCTWQL